MNEDGNTKKVKKLLKSFKACKYIRTSTPLYTWKSLRQIKKYVMKAHFYGLGM